MLSATLFTIAKMWKKTNSALTGECIKAYARILFSFVKKGNSAICYNMDELGGQYAK